VSVGTPLIADDPSVLQTPSHAVLYHLCTSSIRDKMIAVGASTRYRQKVCRAFLGSTMSWADSFDST
jgi:hypothetical protein